MKLERRYTPPEMKTKVAFTTFIDGVTYNTNKHIYNITTHVKCKVHNSMLPDPNNINAKRLQT